MCRSYLFLLAFLPAADEPVLFSDSFAGKL